MVSEATGGTEVAGAARGRGRVVAAARWRELGMLQQQGRDWRGDNSKGRG